MFAQLLLAIDFSEHRMWAVQAAGFATAGLVLMLGRFLTRSRLMRKHGGMPRLHAAGDTARIPEPYSKPHAYRLPSDLAFKVEETWR